MNLGKPSISGAQAERVRALLVERCDRVHRGSRAAFARELGISGPSVSNLLSGINRPGVKVLRRMATLLGTTLDDLLGQGAPERYPNRRIARNYAIGIGVSPEAIARVDALVLKSDRDPHPDEWLRMYRGIDDQLTLFAESPAAAAAADAESVRATDELVEESRPKLPRGRGRKSD